VKDKRVLIAEDDEYVRRGLVRLFEAYGYVVEQGGNYCDVKDLLDTRDYSLIVSDNGMPLSPGSTRIDRRCGLQLLAHAKLGERHKDVPFVLHTADDTDETQRHAREFGGVYKLKGSEPSLIDFCENLLNA
jgi:CheY-like chemotaxis protein